MHSVKSPPTLKELDTDTIAFVVPHRLTCKFPTLTGFLIKAVRVLVGFRRSNFA